VHVTLAKPEAGVDTQPRRGTQLSTVHGSPSSHAEAPTISHSAIACSVVVVGACVVVLVEVVVG